MQPLLLLLLLLLLMCRCESHSGCSLLYKDSRPLLPLLLLLLLLDGCFELSMRPRGGRVSGEEARELKETKLAEAAMLMALLLLGAGARELPSMSAVLLLLATCAAVWVEAWGKLVTRLAAGCSSSGRECWTACGSSDVA
jgi:hypothetical protein